VRIVLCSAARYGVSHRTIGRSFCRKWYRHFGSARLSALSRSVPCSRRVRILLESAEEIGGGAMTRESEGHLRQLDAQCQLAQYRHIQWCRLFSPASTTPLCPLGSTTVGVAGVSIAPDPGPGLRAGGFMGSEPCRGLVTRQFGSGVGSSGGGWTGSGRIRCGGSCGHGGGDVKSRPWRPGTRLAQIMAVLGSPRSAAWLVSGLGEILE
jgi:hypothetical protein